MKKFLNSLMLSLVLLGNVPAVSAGTLTPGSVPEQSAEENKNVKSTYGADLNDDFIGWTKTDATFVAHGTYTENGESHSMQAAFPPTNAFHNSYYHEVPLFDNSIESGGKWHTYANNHAISSGEFVLPGFWANSFLAYVGNQYYTRKDRNGNDQIARVQMVKGTKNNKQMGQISEVITLSTTGAFIHDVKILNNTTAVVNGPFLWGLNSDLDGKDNIPIHADGRDGTYITDRNFTLYNRPIKNVSVSAGNWKYPLQLSDIPAKGKAYGTKLLDRVDTAIWYKTNPFSLSIGETYSFSFMESLSVSPPKPSEPQPVKIFYADDTGSLIGPKFKLLNGKLDEVFNEASPTIPGYTNPNPAVVTGAFTDEEQMFEVQYQKSIPGAPVTINYVDAADGTPIGPNTKLLNGNVGEAFSDPSPQIQGYENPTPATTTGTFTDKAQTMTVKYTRKQGAPVTIKYQDESGNPIPGYPDKSLTGLWGETKTVTLDSIPGYQFVSQTGLTPDNKVTFTDTAQTVILKYKKGTLSLTSAPNLDFGEHKISSAAQKYNAKAIGDLKVNDSRASGGWKLMSRMVTPLTGNKSTKKLENVTYVTQDNETLDINNVNTIIYSSTQHVDGDTVISSFWGNTKGFNLGVLPGQALNDTYSGKMEWTLSDVPQ